MVRININGHLIDIEEGAIGFKRENDLYLWNELKLDRSTEFSIPATATNRAALGFSDDPSEWGGVMRVRLHAQMQYSGGVIDGFFYVSGYSGDAFDCVFYYGASDDVVAISGLQCADIPLDDSQQWSEGLVLSADDPSLSKRLIALIRYEGSHDDETERSTITYNPSVNVKRYIDKLASTAGVVVETEDLPDDLWMVAPTIVGNTMTQGTISKSGIDAASVSASLNDFLGVVQGTLHYHRGGYIGHEYEVIETPCKGFVAKHDISITFPAGVKASWRLRSMRTQNVIGGNAPLAGRTIEMSADTYFFVLDDDDLGRHGQDTDGYGFTVDPSPFSLSLDVSYEGNISLNEYWRLDKNAPDCTFVELMQSASIAAGRVLTYNDEGGTLAIEEQYVGGTFVLGDVISVDEVTRNVDAWGGDTQKVVIGFDSEDYVTRPITKEYGIDNGNIDGTKDVNAMFSEGNAGTFVGDGNNVIIRDWNTEGDEPELTATKWTIARSGSSKLRRIGFISDMTTTRTIAEQSTCVKVKAFVSLDDFMSLGKHSLVIARGCQYVWTSAEWSNGIATMTLQKA